MEMVILVITVKMRVPIMRKLLVVLLHLSLSDLVTSGGFATAFLTGGSPPYLLFLMARTFSCNSTLDDGSQQFPDSPSRTDQRLSSENITIKMVSHTIYNIDASKAP